MGSAAPRTAQDMAQSASMQGTSKQLRQPPAAQLYNRSAERAIMVAEHAVGITPLEEANAERPRAAACSSGSNMQKPALTLQFVIVEAVLGGILLFPAVDRHSVSTGSRTAI